MKIPTPVQGRTVRVPTILQMEALECGAAALGMVLAYYQRWIPLEELRILCGVSRDGSKAINIVKAARSLGLKAGGKRLELDDLARLAVPAILFVNMNHYVVFEGMHKTEFQINDPAGGRRRVSRDEFDRMFSGLVLVFEPTAEFIPGGSTPRLLPRVWALLQQSRQAIMLLLIAGTLMALLSLLLPGFQKIYLDHILISQLDSWVFPLIIALLLVLPLIAVIAWLQGRLVAALGAKLSLVLSSRLVWRILRLPVQFFAQRYAGMVSSRVTLADQLVLTITQILSQALTNIVLMAFLIVLMLQYSLILTSLVVTITLANALLLQWMQRAIGEASEKSEMQLVKMAGKTVQGLTMIETLKSTGTEDFFYSQWAGLQTLYINAQNDMVRREAILTALQTLLGIWAASLVLVVGGYFTMTQEFSIGMLVAFSTITILFNQPVQILVMLSNMVLQARGNLLQVEDTLRYPLATEFADPAGSAPAGSAPAGSARPSIPNPGAKAAAGLRSGPTVETEAKAGDRAGAGTDAEVGDEAGAETETEFGAGTGSGTGIEAGVKSGISPGTGTGSNSIQLLRRLTGRIQMCNIEFAYGPLDPPLLQNFSLEMQPGSRVALVGGSGSGKSTVGKLLAGLLEPDSGEILMDGYPMQAVPRDILRNSLAVVDQDIVLFEGTVRENISLWDDTLPEEYLIAAAKDAMIHEFVLSLRGGYERQIEENGRNLSGGQRQRLEIARALATNPTVLVLDEATSALDTVAEEAIMNNLRRRGCTCLIIAHRLSTIRDCDEIIVMDRGQILQRGTHSGLMAAAGPYRQLIET